MRPVLLLLASALPAAAWDFTAGAPCTLTHAEPPLEVVLTHDPATPLFTITLRRTEPWPVGGIFSITFEGGMTISTNRQILSEEGRALTVADRGFGNVIDGMAGAPGAIARLGDVEERFSLAGAAEPARALEACQPAPAV
ncbi:MAG: hypothetical protein AAFM92_09075 [Pseudomonadota bacterium]